MPSMMARDLPFLRLRLLLRQHRGLAFLLPLLLLLRHLLHLHLRPHLPVRNMRKIRLILPNQLLAGE